MDKIIKSVLLRFVRAFVAGALAVMITITPLTGNWKDLGNWLSTLALAGIVGGIAGVIQAGDKYFRS